MGEGGDWPHLALLSGNTAWSSDKSFLHFQKEKDGVFGAICQAPTYGFYYRKWLPVGLCLVTSVNFITWKLKLAFISDPKEHQAIQ